MPCRLQLLNERLGALTIETDDPIGINEISTIVKRSDEYEGLVYEVSLDFKFIERAREYIILAFETDGGPDAEVNVLLYDYNPNTYRWELDTSGQVEYNKYDIDQESVTVNIGQTGFQRRVMNSMENDVKMSTIVSINGASLPAPKFIPEMLYHSKTLLKEVFARPASNAEYQQIDVIGESYPACATPDGCDRGFNQTAYGQIDFSDPKADELEGFFKTPFGYSASGAFPIYQALEPGTMDFRVKMRLKHTVIGVVTGGDIDFCSSGDSNIGHKEVFAWFRHTDSEDVVKTEVNFGQWTSNVGCGAAGAIGDFETKQYIHDNLNIEIGDKIYVYFTFRIFGDYEQNFGGNSGRIDFTFKVEPDAEQTELSMVQVTTAEASTAKTMLIYEAIERCIQYSSNQVDCFRSNLLGRTDIIGPDGSPLYLQDGKYSMIGFTNGKLLRGMTDNELIFQLKDLVDFINSIACVGFGFERLEDGRQIFRLEHISYFYDKTQTSLVLTGVADIRKKIDTKRLYNQFEFGWSSKVDVGQVNAIDEPNTIRRHTIPVASAKNPLKVSSKMKVSGYQIEFQRRLRDATKDSKLDDENFAVVVIRDGLTFKTKKNEGYAEITGVFSPETGYNYDIMPGRNYENWKPLVATSLIRSFDKVTKFAYGEVNYKVTSRKTGELVPVDEGADVDLSNVEPIFDYMVYTYNHPITRDELKILKANPTFVVEAWDMFGEKIEGFITAKGIKYSKEDGIAEFDLVKVYRKPQ